MVNQTGSVIHLILLAVVLFAALAYAFTSNSRSSGALVESEIKNANSLQSTAFGTELKMAMKRLRLRGCDASEISFEGPPFDGSTGSVNALSPRDHSCHLFHLNGGGIVYTGADIPCVNTSQLTGLQVGEACGSVVYAGDFAGARLYTTLTDGPSLSWNDGSSNWLDLPIANCNSDLSQASCNNGAANTDSLVQQSANPSPAPYLAAQYCADLEVQGFDDWYLPSANEIHVVYTNRNAIDNLSLTGGTASYYWTSSEANFSSVRGFVFENGVQYSQPKYNSFPVRCIRR